MAFFRLLIDYDVVVYVEGLPKADRRAIRDRLVEIRDFPRIAQITSSTMPSVGRWRSTSAARLRSSSGWITPISRSKFSTSIRLTGGARSVRDV